MTCWRECIYSKSPSIKFISSSAVHIQTSSPSVIEDIDIKLLLLLVATYMNHCGYYMRNTDVFCAILSYFMFFVLLYVVICCFVV